MRLKKTVWLFYVCPRSQSLHQYECEWIVLLLLRWARGWSCGSQRRTSCEAVGGGGTRWPVPSLGCEGSTRRRSLQCRRL